MKAAAFINYDLINAILNIFTSKYLSIQGSNFSI